MKNNIGKKYSNKSFFKGFYLFILVSSCQGSIHNTEYQQDYRINYILNQNDSFRSLNYQDINYIVARYLETNDTALYPLIQKRYELLKRYESFNQTLLSIFQEREDISSYFDNKSLAYLFRMITEESYPLRYKLTQIEETDEGIYLCTKVIMPSKKCSLTGNVNVSRDCFELVESFKIEITVFQYENFLKFIDNTGIKYQMSINFIEEEVCSNTSFSSIDVVFKKRSSNIKKYKIINYCGYNSISQTAIISKEIIRLKESVSPQK